jgi:hypothetical protein
MLDPELELQVDELCNLNPKGNPTEKDVFDIYAWIDSLEFSRPKRNITRDFSDGGTRFWELKLHVNHESKVGK